MKVQYTKVKDFKHWRDVCQKCDFLGGLSKVIPNNNNNNNKG